MIWLLLSSRSKIAETRIDKCIVPAVVSLWVLQRETRPTIADAVEALIEISESGVG